VRPCRGAGVRRAILAVALLVLAGCGGGQKTISESAVVEAMHGAGLADVHRLTGPKAPSPSAFAADGRDLFYVGPFRPGGRFELAVLWSASAPPAVNVDPRERSARVHQA